MGYTVYYTKTWLIPFGKQTPYPPAYQGEPSSPGDPPPYEIDYVEPISFMGCAVNCIPGYFYFQIVVNTRYWTEGDSIRMTTVRNVVLNEYSITFDCYLAEELRWSYIHIIDLLPFPKAMIATRGWVGDSDPRLNPYPGAESTSLFHEGEGEEWLQYAGCRFHFPYVLAPPSPPQAIISASGFTPWNQRVAS